MTTRFLMLTNITDIFNSAICVVSGKLMLTNINLTIGVMTVKASN